MKNIYWSLIILTTTFFACQQKNDYLISEEKFVDILVDIHLADALYSANQYGQLNLSKIDSSVYYESIYEKYNIDKARFDSTLTTYTLHPKTMESIYEQVIEKLQKIQSENEKKSKETKE